MTQSEIVEHILDGIKPEIATPLMAMDLRRVDAMIENAKRIERGILYSQNYQRNVRFTDESNAVRQLDVIVDKLSKLISNNRDQNSSRNTRTFDTNNTRRIDGKPKCFACGRMGHVAKYCQNNSANRQMQAQSNRNDVPRNSSEGNFTTNSVTRVNGESESQKNKRDNKMNICDYIMTPVFIKGKRVNGLVDTGSAVTIMSKEFAVLNNIELLPYSGQELRACNETVLEICAEVKVKIMFTDNENMLNSRLVSAFVVDNFQFPLLIGNDFMRIANAVVDCSKRKVIFESSKFKICPSNGTNDTEVILDNEVNLPIRDNAVTVCDKTSNCASKPSSKMEMTTKIKSNNTRKERKKNASVFNTQKSGYQSNLTTTKESATETINIGTGSVKVNANLSAKQKLELQEVLTKFSDRFAFDNAYIGQCKDMEHKIDFEGLPMK
ncbi:hypothetical protein B4U80_13893 [Leptotrombidium deliense]|uniref:CCHC-type domain-containing protein n=1 Tax=Leptotrombidium deliense TaxID=299467 RepID=A0A443S8V1_9ACAR|nr:hypothetical protein B4U80_13893 [Leptotrombidium deliense]